MTIITSDPTAVVQSLNQSRLTGTMLKGDPEMKTWSMKQLIEDCVTSLGFGQDSSRRNADSKRNAESRHRQSVGVELESLEQRLMMSSSVTQNSLGDVLIVGSRRNDNVQVKSPGNSVIVELNGSVRRFNEDSVRRIVFKGGRGHDTFSNSTRYRVIARGGLGNDTLTGGKGSDIMLGQAGNDHLIGYHGHDVLVGGAGNDILEGGLGRDRAVGGTGNDRCTASSFAKSSGCDGELNSDRPQPEDSSIHVVESNGVLTITGSPNDDTIVLRKKGGQMSVDGVPRSFAASSLSRIEINARGGDDRVLLAPAGFEGAQAIWTRTRILGGAGDDIILGGAGNDEIEGGEGRDMIIDLLGSNHLSGRTGNDLIMGGFGTDDIQGGDGMDVLIGGAGSDHIQGNRGMDLIFGGAGDDSVLGGNDTDIILGQAGNDELSGQRDNDYVDGGDGSDTLFGDHGDDVVFAGSDGSPNAINGGIGNDVLYGGSGVEVIMAGDGNDVLSGGGSNDVLAGEAGIDILLGGAGMDLLSGGDGNDYLDGNSGYDYLYGQAGDDILGDDWYNWKDSGGSISDTVLSRPAKVDFVGTAPSSSGCNQGIETDPGLGAMAQVRKVSCLLKSPLTDQRAQKELDKVAAGSSLQTGLVAGDIAVQQVRNSVRTWELQWQSDKEVNDIIREKDYWWARDQSPCTNDGC